MAPNLSGIAASDAARMAAPGRAGGRFRRSATCARTARWSARSFTAAATASSSSSSRTSFGPSSRSSRRPRATKSAETFLVGIGLKPRASGVAIMHAIARSCRGANRPAARGLDWTKIGPRCRGVGAQPACRAARRPLERSHGEQSMVFEGRCLAGDRTRAVHRLQAVRPRRDAQGDADRLLRFPRGGARQAHQAASRCRKARRRHRDPRQHQRRQANCAPPPPTSTAAWSAT